jgi:hypothetical protein
MRKSIKPRDERATPADDDAATIAQILSQPRRPPLKRAGHGGRHPWSPLRRRTPH